MIIGIPKEIMHDEARVAATPETVGKFVKDGFEVLVERHAGDGALYHDEDYIQAGAKIVDNPQEIYDRAEMILKVKEPLMNEPLHKHEVDMMHKGQVLITFIHPASPVNHEMVKALSAKGVTAITLDGIPRISRAQSMDALTSMSTCAGYKGILMAADRLTTFVPQMFTAVGQIKPAKVMVIGVGVAGLQALATAKRLGAITYAADIRPMASENAMSLGAKVVDTTVPPELAIAEGGYANRLPADVLIQEQEALKATIQEMDIVLRPHPRQDRPDHHHGRDGEGHEEGFRHRGHLHRPGRQLRTYSEGRHRDQVRRDADGGEEHPRPPADELHLDVLQQPLQPRELPGQGRQVRPRPQRRDHPEVAGVHRRPAGPSGRPRGHGLMIHPLILIAVFLVSAVLGYFIIRTVPSLLHTPLMSGMNALSGVTIVGAIVATGVAFLAGDGLWAQLAGGLAIVLAAVNVFGGFGVTHRMLKMFDKKKK